MNGVCWHTKWIYKLRVRDWSTRYGYYIAIRVARLKAAHPACKDFLSNDAFDKVWQGG